MDDDNIKPGDMFIHNTAVYGGVQMCILVLSDIEDLHGDGRHLVFPVLLSPNFESPKFDSKPRLAKIPVSWFRKFHRV